MISASWSDGVRLSGATDIVCTEIAFLIHGAADALDPITVLEAVRAGLADNFTLVNAYNYMDLILDERGYERK